MRMENLWKLSAKTACAVLLSKSAMNFIPNIGLFFFLICINVSASSCDFDDFPVPRGMDVYPILDNVIQNNRAILAKGFVAPSHSVEDLQEYYKRRWDDRVLFTLYNSWKQIVTLRDDCLYTVQIGEQPDGALHGRLIMSPAPTGPVGNLGEGLVLPRGAEVVSDTRMDDGPKRGRVAIISARDKSARGLGNFYKSKLAHRGWNLEQEFSEGGSVGLIFRKGLDTTNIVITQAIDGAQVVLQEEIVK